MLSFQECRCFYGDQMGAAVLHLSHQLVSREVSFSRWRVHSPDEPQRPHESSFSSLAVASVQAGEG